MNSIESSSEYTCEFVPVQSSVSTGKFICQWCGRIAIGVESEKKVSCTGERTAEFTGPSLAEKGFNFFKSYLLHIFAGSPECTAGQIIERFEKCISCDRYNRVPDPHGSCCECGCYVNTLLARNGLNKLAWAEQECPYPDGPKWWSVDSECG